MSSNDIQSLWQVINNNGIVRDTCLSIISGLSYFFILLSLPRVLFVLPYNRVGAPSQLGNNNKMTSTQIPLSFDLL
jgi:hypothetical protein